jgi:hypothetical protein
MKLECEIGGIFFYSGKILVTLKDLCQAGPDIGDMELRRSMLEPEVGCGHLQQLLVTLVDTC